jgi:hypothetical protein
MEDFTTFNKGQTNRVKAMHTELFNKFIYLSAVVIHHRSEVQEFLQIHDTMTNPLACIASQCIPGGGSCHWYLVDRAISCSDLLSSSNFYEMNLALGIMIKVVQI